MILFFDTETTGIPRNYKAPYTDTRNWPRVVQLAWMVCDPAGQPVSEGNLLIRPDGFVIPPDATRVHGISQEMALREGIPVAAALAQFTAAVATAHTLVAHNFSFDENILNCELYRVQQAPFTLGKTQVCTMLSTTKFCAIPNRFGLKWPKLAELYRKLFQEEIEDAHDALNDVRATAKCYWELKRRRVI